ncbi:MAG: hypothetical protein SVJ22_02805, partial [Halobacteriota archaeon]|nr:hypothetical protein [Halobacteriota archaeon]
FNVSDFDNPIPVIDNTTGFARIGAFQSENPGLNGDVGIVNLILTAVGDAGSFTTFDITVNELKEATPEGIDVPATVEDSMFTIRGDGNSVISCDSSGDEKNMFMPGEEIYVKAEGLSPSTSYKVWIQDNPVSDGDTLIASEDPSGGQEVVTSDGSGGISPTLIWDIPSDAAVTHHEYDIVLDNQIGSDVGVYNSASDRIDSATAAGVTAPVPELTSIAMVLMGIMVILGYVRNHKEK